MPLERISFRVDGRHLDRLDAICKIRGHSRAQAVRSAVEMFVRSPEWAPANFNRIAQTTEFMQIALDLLVSRDMPDKRDAIITTVAQRMEELHGGR
jgi:metal-responsive CopG/Arc/MetJ family transcriptional regulator